MSTFPKLDIHEEHLSLLPIMSTDTMREPVSGTLEREETPPSLQTPELAIISRRRLATEQKRYPVSVIR